MNRLLCASVLWLFVLAACGGASTTATTADRADEEEDEEDEEDEERFAEEDEEEADDEGGFVDAALLRDMNGDLSLGEPTAVRGTGVTFRPPVGAEPMPFGAGFLLLRQRIQLTVVVAVGGPAVLDMIRTGGDPNAPQPDAESEIEIAGHQGRLGRDTVRTEAGTLERQWLLVHDGTRGLGLTATYESERARSYRRTIRESLSSVEWDHESPLDASAALGIDVGPVDGLEASNRSTANLVMLVPGEAFPPERGQAVLTVSPLPVRIPEDRIAALCSRLAASFVPLPSERIEHEGEVEDGQLPGCERYGTSEVGDDGDELASYAALLFHQGTPILVAATVDADEMSTWRPRFASAARTVRVR